MLVFSFFLLQLRGANEMIVNYLLKSGEQFILVFLVPDDIPKVAQQQLNEMQTRCGQSTKTGTQGTLLNHPFPSSPIIILTLAKG